MVLSLTCKADICKMATLVRRALQSDAKAHAQTCHAHVVQQVNEPSMACPKVTTALHHRLTGMQIAALAVDALAEASSQGMDELAVTVFPGSSSLGSCCALLLSSRSRDWLSIEAACAEFSMTADAGEL